MHNDFLIKEYFGSKYIQNNLTDNSILLNFSVEDSGIGISEDKLVRIFERYEQAAATIKTQFGGTGLGLSITKKIIELMNGTIGVKSTFNTGTIFTVTIPFTINNDNSTLQYIEKIDDTSFLDNYNIIIADDNVDSRLLLNDILLHFNSSVNIKDAENGKEVLELLNEQIPDVILIDLDMPVLNGFETVVEIHKMANTSSVKIIAHTASLLTMSSEEIFSLGFDALLIKPFKPYDLLEILNQLNNKAES